MFKSIPQKITEYEIPFEASLLTAVGLVMLNFSSVSFSQESIIVQSPSEMHLN